MNDPTRNFHGGNPNSVAAFETAKQFRAANIAHIADLLGSCPPRTCGDYPHACADEIQYLLERQGHPAGKSQTISARFTDAKTIRVMESAGHNHRTRSKQPAEAFRLASSTECPFCGEDSPAVRDALIYESRCSACGVSRDKVHTRRKKEKDLELANRLSEALFRIKNLCEQGETVSSAWVLSIIVSVFRNIPGE